MRALLLLVLALYSLHAPTQAARLRSTQSSLPHTIHFTRPRDLRAIWLLRSSTSTCPRNITHTSWSTSDTIYTLRHDSIIQDNKRCTTHSRENVLTFRPRTDFDDTLAPVNGPPLPAETLRQLRGDTVARRALEAGDRAEEEFMLGYEQRVRQCGGVASFEDGTVVFVFRPFTDQLEMEGVDERLGRTRKWMVIAPREGGLCVYDSDVNGPDDGARGNGQDGDGDGDGDGDESGTGGEDDGPACFPGDAMVETRTRGPVKISDVGIGEFVASGKGSWTRVIGFSHHDPVARTRMVVITLTSGERIRASQGHYLYTANGATAASDINLNDSIKLEDGSMSRVTSVQRVLETGLYNLQTESGDVVVDGIWASTYTTAVRTEIAHAALAPLRLLVRLVEWDFVKAAVDDGGLWRIAATRFVS